MGPLLKFLSGTDFTIPAEESLIAERKQTPLGKISRCEANHHDTADYYFHPHKRRDESRILNHHCPFKGCSLTPYFGFLGGSCPFLQWWNIKCVKSRCFQQYSCGTKAGMACRQFFGLNVTTMNAGGTKQMPLLFGIPFWSQFSYFFQFFTSCSEY